MNKDEKVTLEMLRQDAERAREEAISKQALQDGGLKDNCLWILYVAMEELRKRDYGETIIIRITGLRGNPEYSVGSRALNLQSLPNIKESLPSIKEVRKVLGEIPALKEVGNQYVDTQILLRFA